MIDRPSRDQLALLLQQLASRQITPAAFTAALPKTKDRAVREIVGQSRILLDDLREDALAAPRGQERSEVVRWTLFLQSDLEYEWPSLPTWARVVGFLPSLLTLGLFWTPYRLWFQRRGDWRVWPFLRDEDYKAARKKRATA